MDLITQHKVEQFAQLAIKAGWEWCGVQEAIPPALPRLVIQKWRVTKRPPFDPNDFDPIKLATLYFTPETKMTDTPKLNLRQKLVEIYKELDHVDKAGENTKQHYFFVRAADVMRPVRDVFAKYGIYAEPNVEYLGFYDIKTNSGGNMHTAIVKVTIKLYDTDSDETKTISGLGDGADSGDKGIYKAQTGAIKNALRNGLLIPDEGDPNGGDPEADQNVDNNTSAPLRDYTDYPRPNDVPDFQDAQRGPVKSNPAPRPTVAVDPKTTATSARVVPGSSQAVQSMATPISSGVFVADAPSKTETAQAAAPEHGDAYEGPDSDALPTEEQLVTYRAKFKTLGDDLAAKGKLTASRSLPVNRKVHVFLLSITKAPDAKQISKNQWDNFFKRVDTATANPEVGLVGLATLVNKANGIEPKQ